MVVDKKKKSPSNYSKTVILWKLVLTSQVNSPSWPHSQQAEPIARHALEPPWKPSIIISINRNSKPPAWETQKANCTSSYSTLLDSQYHKYVICHQILVLMYIILFVRCDWDVEMFLLSCFSFNLVMLAHTIELFAWKGRHHIRKFFRSVCCWLLPNSIQCW